MQTRAEATDWLNARGYYAVAHDSAVGKSIYIAKRRVVNSDGLQVFEPTCMVLYRADGCQWNVLSQKVSACDTIFSSLAEAVDHAIGVLDGY